VRLRPVLLAVLVGVVAVAAAVALLSLSRPDATPSTAPDSPATAALPPDGEPRDGEPPLSEPVGRYVALGDSFTAGPLIPYVDADRAACLRSSANYPAVLGRWLRADRLVDVSCSGADTEDLRAEQLRSVTAVTDLVTVGIGGNDFSIFATLAQRCAELAGTAPTGAPCRGALRRADGTNPLLAQADRVGRRLAGALRTVAERAPDAVVAVVGYPRILPASGTCTSVPLAAGDYAFADRVERRLNSALRAAATQADATYVDTYGPSRGHDACAGGAAWVNGQDTRAVRALGFHPYASGMRAAAAAAYRTLTGDQPTALMRDRAERLTGRRPPGTLTLREQRLVAALLGAG